MILYAMIVRTSDGLPLTASTDVGGQIYREVQETRKHMKTLSRKLTRLDDRCTLKLNPHVVHFISSLGVSFLALCEPSYPSVLAFSFLDELLREFITEYDTKQVSNAVRPYTFIEFDSFIQKTRQRYNNPRSLTTKVNLSDLSTEIKLRPPQQLSIEDIIPKSVAYSPVPLSSGGDVRLQTLTVGNVLALTLSTVCALFNLYRGVAALGESSIDDEDRANPLHGVIFLVQASLHCSQIYLLINYTRWRSLISWLVLLSYVICHLLVRDIQEPWQMLIFVGVASCTTASIILRKPQAKMPNYNV